MEDSLQFSQTRQVRYKTSAGYQVRGYFHRYIKRQGDYVGYSMAALIETEIGKVVIVPITDFKFSFPPTAKMRRVGFINSKNVTDIGYFHDWIVRQGNYVGYDTFAMVETKSGELVFLPHNKIIFEKK